jgi:dTDP-4-dehydrorhamnose reductase
MKILLLGADGQVGWELRRALQPLGNVVSCVRADVDLSNLNTLRHAVQRHAPEIIVNAAAYTAVDKAESEQELAERINAEAVAVLAQEALRANAWLVHYSTDYVFDGKKRGAYVETDATNPVSVYGLSKVHGEEAIQDMNCRHFIFRTSWVYAVRGHNFPKTMLRLALSRDTLRVVADQVGAPTSADLIADVTALVLAQAIRAPRGAPAGEGGLFHLTAQGSVSWRGFARYVLAAAAWKGWTLKVPAEQVVAITTAEYPTAAKRIANSVLATDKLRATFGLTLPAWETGVDRFMAELSRDNL